MVRSAVSEGSLPFYQRILPLKGRSLKYEALGRIAYCGQVLSPDSFLSHLEGTDDLCRFDFLILDHAIAQMASWDADGFDSVNVNVNASSQSLELGGYASHIEKLLRMHGVRAENLTIEIIEPCTFWKNPRILWTLERLRSLGVGVAIDDFPCWGDPEGLLVWLRQNAHLISSLKLDRSLVRPACDNKGGIALAQLVRYTTEAHSLGLTVVAEGVEDERDMATMRLCNVDALQGFGIGKPEPACKVRHQVVVPRVWKSTSTRNARQSEMMA